MKTKWIVLITLFLLILPTQVQGQDAASILLQRINDLRTSLGLTPYRLDSALTAAAQVQANWMVANDDWQHTHPDGNSVRDRTAAAGYSSSWVSENTYIGGLATVDSAWQFWLSSSVHYQGMTNAAYDDIGIATASSPDNHGFVLVFGNSVNNSPTSSSGNNGSSANRADSGPPEQPPYVVGRDEVGNIMHQIQPGDDMGTIALYYGYTWGDLPAIRDLNGMTEADDSTLEIGAILLIPPRDGTYTPTPNQENRPTEETPTAESSPELQPETTDESPTAISAVPQVEITIIIPSPTPTLPSPAEMTAAIRSAQSPQSTTVALVPPMQALPTTFGDMIAPETIEVVVVKEDNNNTMMLLLGLAIVFQVALLGAAGVEFVKRRR